MTLPRNPLVALLAGAVLALPSASIAQDMRHDDMRHDEMHHHHAPPPPRHHMHCTWGWHHHHRVKVCR